MSASSRLKKLPAGRARRAAHVRRLERPTAAAARGCRPLGVAPTSYPGGRLCALAVAPGVAGRDAPPTGAAVAWTAGRRPSVAVAVASTAGIAGSGSTRRRACSRGHRRRGPSPLGCGRRRAAARAGIDDHEAGPLIVVGVEHTPSSDSRTARSTRSRTANRGTAARSTARDRRSPSASTTNRPATDAPVGRSTTNFCGKRQRDHQIDDAAGRRRRRARRAACR